MDLAGRAPHLAGFFVAYSLAMLVESMHTYVRYHIIMSPPQNTYQDTRDGRHQCIVELLQKNAIRSQAALQELLALKGFEVNQGTLSRDLRDLSVMKGKDGYELQTMPDMATGTAHQHLWHIVKTSLIEATPAENLLVLHTAVGSAQPLGLALDNVELPGLVGTIAGDDTVLAICQSASKARSLAKKLMSNQRPR